MFLLTLAIPNQVYMNAANGVWGMLGSAGLFYGELFYAIMLCSDCPLAYFFFLWLDTLASVLFLQCSLA